MKALLLGLGLGISLGAGGVLGKIELDSRPAFAAESCLILTPKGAESSLPVYVAEFDKKRQSYKLLILGFIPATIHKIDLEDENEVAVVKMNCETGEPLEQ